MASSIQFSGLASGLDTTSIITSLMEAEKLPQTRLKSRLSTAQTQLSALQQVNTSLAALSTSAKSFASGSTWTQLSATSSSSAVTVTASSSALTTSFSVNVKSTAAAAQGSLSAGALAGATGTLTLKGSAADSPAITFAATDSLDAVAAKINASTKTSALQAQLVAKADGGAVLLISSTKTGLASNFTITDESGGAPIVETTNGTDAQVSLGNGVTVTSATNTFTNLMPGIDVTLGATADTTTKSVVTVAADGSTRATAVKAFVSQLNDALTLISRTTSYGTITAGQAAAGGGVLPGDSSLRAISDQLLNTVFPGGMSSMAPYGLSIDRYGQFTFDATKFSAAYAADPEAVQAAFTGTKAANGNPAVVGFAQRVQKVADLASDAYDGSLSQYIKGQNSEIDRYTDQISAWDDRLAAKQASLEQLYTALTKKLSTLQSQQSWLSSQIESLDGLSSSKK